MFGLHKIFMNMVTLWDITKKCLDFGDLDLIFKVTAVEKLKIQGWWTSVFSENTITCYYNHFNIKLFGGKWHLRVDV